MKAMKFLLPGVVAGAISFAAPAIAQESFASHLYVGANGGQGHWRAMCPSGSSKAIRSLAGRSAAGLEGTTERRPSIQLTMSLSARSRINKNRL